jgi:hypothetical protein
MLIFYGSPGTPSGSYPPSVASPRTSGPAVTGSPHRSTAAKWTPDSPPGTRSPARPPQQPDTAPGITRSGPDPASTTKQAHQVDSAHVAV